mgnify:CR=1 FL=1
MSDGKNEGDASDFKNFAFLLQEEAADSHYYRQESGGMKQTTPVISDGIRGRGDVEHGKTYDILHVFGLCFLVCRPGH